MRKRGTNRSPALSLAYASGSLKLVYRPRPECRLQKRTNLADMKAG